jgi:uncharacterized delta-60 repeat protein
LRKFDTFGVGHASFATNILIEPDGKIVLAGVAFGDAELPQLCLIRFNADGTPDTSFGDGGTFATGIAFRPVEMALEPDGEILVAGTRQQNSDDVPFVPSGIAAITADGKLDRQFGWNGLLSNPADMDTLTDLKLQPHGTFLVSGTEGGHPVLARFTTSTGALDPTFRHGGAIEASNVVQPVPVSQWTPPLLLGVTADNKLVEWFGGQTIHRWLGASISSADDQPTKVGQGPVDALPPLPTLEALRPVSGGGHRCKFTVTYRDFQSGISAASMGDANVSVLDNDNKPLKAKLISTKLVADSDGSTAIAATYSFRPPGGKWSVKSNGQYAFNLVGAQVSDNAGNTAPGTFLGSLSVFLKPPASLLTRIQRRWV